ncbi:helix-turn-helix domain-containing protein, partial [Pseudolysinimonas sp.]|uniref:helix-turn-helix domain-containing protein n=1 Tax=Pseudolysinimonas sp. TaxID=2680009 RepID=UPI00286B0E12
MADSGTRALTDVETLTVLRHLYRARTATVAELSEHAALPPTRLADILDDLERAGFLRRVGTTIEPISPDVAVATILARVVAGQQASAAAVGHLLRALPTITKDWELGASGSEFGLTAEIVHGYRAQWDTWARFASEGPPRQLICLFPDLTVLRGIVALGAGEVDALAGIDIAMRGILPTSVCADPAAQPTLELLEAAGMEIRTLPQVPNWICVDDGVYAAIPLTWADRAPGSILVIRHPSIVSALSYVAETQWSLAMPFRTVTDGWESVLRLLTDGLSDHAIARALGTS